ncbi:MAG: sulfate ABC transporter substrate-binding protein [Alphaproteobacteria bacterium]
MTNWFSTTVRSSSFRTVILTTLLLAVLVYALVLAFPARAQTVLLNVSYDSTRELYKEMNDAFAAEWKATTGKTVTVRASHGSGKQARAVIDGLEADVVTLALAADIDAIAAITKKLPANWQQRLPNDSAPYTSTIVFLVRKGNPKGIKDWDDLTKPGIEVITPNPKTSGGARWNYLAAWGYAAEKFGSDDAKIKSFVAQIYKNAPVLDTGARAATVTFAEREIGDVLIAWETEAFLAIEEFGEERFDLVLPSVSILTVPPVALIDANVDRKRTRKQAEAYLQFLYSPQGQAIAAKHYYRPSMPTPAAAADVARLPQVRMLTLEQVAGDWTRAQATHFSNGGVFDQIYAGR